MYPAAMKQGLCANMQKSEHMYFTFAFYNEFLRSKYHATSIISPSAKNPGVLSSGVLMLMLMNFYVAVNVLCCRNPDF